MKTYLIQRNLPNAGNLSKAEQIAIAKRSVSVIEELGPDRIEWQHSYITADNLWCVYKAESEEILVEHAKRGQFPCDNIREVKGMFSPATALLKAEVV
jgi:hypothetical protein